MADFDPYRKWLGIPSHEQPPNYYRLLGLTRYETDTDVIANAADRQMAHLRTFQGGKNSAISQQLLNEVAAARICLLDLKKKAEYDAWLKTEGGMQVVNLTVPVEETPLNNRGNEPLGLLENETLEEFAEIPPIIQFPARTIPPTMPYRAHRRRNHRWQSRLVAWIALGVILLIAGGFIYYTLDKKALPPIEKKQMENRKNTPPQPSQPSPSASLRKGENGADKSAKENPPPKANLSSKETRPVPVKPVGDNAAENEKLGRQLCFVKGDWAEGLPKLAASKSEELKTLAQKELAGPKSIADRLAVADGWWAVGENSESQTRNQIRRHAVEWYQNVLGELDEGPDRDRAEWHIDQMTPPAPGMKRAVNPDELE